jgi:hypothetical protein
MTQDTEQQTFRGVKCLHCKQPIPISPVIAGIEAEARDNNPKPAKHQKRQMFNLRCESCGKEKPYKISEIAEFVEEPVTVGDSSESTSMRFEWMREKSRSASA